jgi:hypothetical protein
VTAPSRMAPPLASVVVASNRDRALLDACLASIIPQCAAEDAELIVARAASPDTRQALAKAHPTVRFVWSDPGTDIPRLRGEGMRRARGSVVALTEDHCVATPGWLRALMDGAQQGATAVGGGMDNARRQRAVDWAAYFSEYGFFAATRRENGGMPLLTGANVAYARAALPVVTDLAIRGEWENVAHEALAARGLPLRFRPDAVVAQNQTYSAAAFCIDRYVHGRDYARVRLRTPTLARRWMLLAATPILPFLLTWRVARAAAQPRPAVFLRALPATLLFFVAWSVGEAVGYLRGPQEARDADSR